MNKNRFTPVRPRLRFREQDDLALLREVLSFNPLLDPNLWVAIQDHLLIISGKNFSIKTLRDHLLLLIQQWLEKTKDLKDKSGIEESYSEKDHLCHQINEMMGENAKVKRIKKPKKQENLGRIIRDKFAEEAAENNMMENTKEHDVMENKENDVMENNKENDVIENNKGNSDYMLDHGYFFIAEEVTLGDNVIQNEMNIPSHDENKSGAPTPTSTGNRNEDNNRKRKIEEKRVLQRVRARTRRTNAQKQGLEYLENYEKTQNVFKKIEQNQTQQRLNIEKEKLVTENRRLDLDEKKFLLEEYERKKIFELLEEKMKNETRERDQLLNVIERQESIINALLENKYRTN